ncbi:hypothetical protein [Vogesella indigofera]|uniref:hypothetical protein n=1 Tax=Vogesella indigofera TaxID=45465 RepID=UPI00234EFB35|nr:hypothetical protein [Vogesella indigofera]MDC7712481.1 hypothetical protein [Vogesella indigofera]
MTHYWLFFKRSFDMYLIVIAWLYVVLMLSVVQDSLIRAGILLFFLGFLPTLIVLRLRRRRIRRLKNPDGEF